MTLKLWRAKSLSRIFSVCLTLTTFLPHTKPQQNRFGNGTLISRMKRFSVVWDLNRSTKSGSVPIIPVTESHTNRYNQPEIKSRGSDGDGTKAISTDPNDIKKTVEQMTFFQSLLGDMAATKVKEKYAEMSFHWANKAQSVVSSTYKNVIQLTRESQEAEILSLHSSSTAQLIYEAVLKADRVYQSSILRFLTLSALAESAKLNVLLVTKAHSLLQGIHNIQQKVSLESRARAFNISTSHLKKVLEDLHMSMDVARNTKSVVVEMR